MEEIRSRMKGLDQRLTQVKKELGKLTRQLSPECQPDNLEPSVDRIDLYISQILEEIVAAAKIQEDEKKLFKLTLKQKLISECYNRRAIILLERIPTYEDPPLDYFEDLPPSISPNSPELDPNYVDIKDETPSTSWNLVEYSAQDGQDQNLQNDTSSIKSEEISNYKEIPALASLIIQKRRRSSRKKLPPKPKLDQILYKPIAKKKKNPPPPPPRPPRDYSNHFHCPIEGCTQKFRPDRQISFEFHKLWHREPSISTYKPNSGICPICPKLYEPTKASTLQYHILSKHFNINILPFPCPIPGCGKKFKSAGTAKSHERSHSNTTYPCPDCDLVCKSEMIFIRHRAMFHAPLKCPQCPRTFTKERALHKHVNEHGITIVCEICGKDMALSKLSTHIQMRHGTHKCGVVGCHLEFGSSEERRTHLEAEHTPEMICDQCTKSYYTLTDLKAHRRIHQISFFCDWEGCARGFTGKADLLRHVEIHQKDFEAQEALRKSGGPTFPCELCGRVYPQLQSLIYHKESFHATTNYICDYEGCGKSFKHVRLLQQHKLYHIKGESECDVCHKIYASQAMLKEHRSRVHRKEIDLGFNCGVCGDSYARKGLLDRHLKKVHGVC